MLDKKEKKELVSKFQKHTTDSGSPDVQVAIFTATIKQIAAHLAKNKKDYSALRGLQKLVAKRKKLLAYILAHDSNRYSSLIQELGIRG
jgi:small subunit ribosomal protein S15